MDPPRAKRGYLIINKRKHPVFEGLNPIGRSKQSTVTILDHTISHQQATIVIIRDKHYICDMNSCNGTQLEHEKLVPLQLYELNGKKKIYFGNVKAIYETVLQDSNTQEISQLSQINDSVFDAPTQSLSLPDVTASAANIVDSRAIGDHAHFDGCVTVHRESFTSDVTEPAINKSIVRVIEAALQEADRDRRKEVKEEKVEVVAKAGEVSSLDIHDLPTQLIEDLGIPICLANTKSASLKLSRSDKSEKDIENDNRKGVSKTVSIYDMPTQIEFDIDDPKIKNDSQNSDDILQQVNEDLQNLPDKTWDEDFFSNNIHDEPTQLVTPKVTVKEATTDKISINSLPTQLCAVPKVVDDENKSINKLKVIEEQDSRISTNLQTQLATLPKGNLGCEEIKSIVTSSIQNEKNHTVEEQDNNSLQTQITTLSVSKVMSKQPNEKAETSDSEEEMVHSTAADDSNIIEETVINETVQNNEEGDENSNCSTDFLTMQPTTQLIENNLTSENVNPRLSLRVKNAITSNDTNEKKGEESSDETDVEAPAPFEESQQSSLKTKLLKKRVKNVITSGDEDEEASDENSNCSADFLTTQAATQLLEDNLSDLASKINRSVSNYNFASSSKVDKLKRRRVKNAVTSDDDGEESSDETDAEAPTLSEESQFSLKVKLLKNRVRNIITSSDENSQNNERKKDEDSSDETDVEFPISVKRDDKKIPNIDDDSDTDVEKENLPEKDFNAHSSSILNDSDFIPATQNCLPETISSLKKKLESDKVSPAPSSSEESVDYSLKLMLTESLVTDDTLNIQKNKENEIKEIKKTSQDITVIENDDDDIFLAATQPITSSKSDTKLSAAPFIPSVGDVDDDIFLKPTQEICKNEDRPQQKNEAKLPENDDIFMQETQPVEKESLFIQPTKPAVSKNKISPCQLASVKRLAEKMSKQINLSSIISDDDVFLQATQPVSTNNEQCNEPTEDATINNDNDVFIQQTQAVTSNVKNNNDDDIFLQSTQPVVSSGEIPDSNFKRPNLEICKFPVIQVRGDIFNNPPRNVNSVEATMQRLFQTQQSQDDVVFKPTPRVQPSVESQLEILFASQSPSGARNDFRPQNPLANILEKLQSENEIILPRAESEDKVNDKEEDNLSALENNEEAKEKNKSKDKEQDKKKEKIKDKNKDQGGKVSDKNREQDKTKGKELEEPKEQEKKNQDDKKEDTPRKGDQKEKSKSHKKTDKTKRRESKKKEKDDGAKKDKKRERKSKNEEELVEILQASKVEKERIRRQTQRTRSEMEKTSRKLSTRRNSQDDDESLKKSDSKNLNVQSRENSKSPTRPVPSPDKESIKTSNQRRSRANSSKKSSASTDSDENFKNTETKRTRSVEKANSDSSKKKTRAHSSSPLQLKSPRSDESDHKEKTTEKSSSSKRTSPRTELADEKNKSSTEKEEKESGKLQNPTKRSHRTRKTLRSLSPQLTDGNVGDSTVKQSESTTNILEEPNSPLGDNTYSFLLLRRSKRKTNSERAAYKSRLKKHKKEPELSLIEELPEVSERTDTSQLSINTEPDNKEDSNKKEVETTPVKTSKSTCRIVDTPGTSTSGKSEDDNSLVSVKRTRQKHRRRSSNSEDDFTVKATSKRSRLDVLTTDSAQSSNLSDYSFSSSSVPDKPERSKRKLKPKVVFTMMDNPELESLIRRLGGSVVDGVDSSTVLVTLNVKRSQKLLAAVGQGKPICSPHWLEESKKANKFLDPWDHILRDEEAEKKWNFSLEESLNRSQNKKLLENYVVLLLVNVAVDVLKGAIEACGGKTTLRCPAKYQELENFVIVSNEESKSKHSRFLKHNPKPTIVAAEAIFDAVLRQEINFDKHLLL